MIKDATTEMITTKLANKELTQTIDTELVRNAEETAKIDETQKIDLNELKQTTQETVVAANEGLNNLPEHTMIIDTTSNINNEEVEKEIISNTFSKIHFMCNNNHSHTFMCKFFHFF